MLHEQESLYTLRGHQEALAYLSKQKQLGRIGAVGMSTHHVAAVKAAWRFPEIQVIHPLINAGGVGIQGGTLYDMEGAVASAHNQGAGIFVTKAGRRPSDRRFAGCVFAYTFQAVDRRGGGGHAGPLPKLTPMCALKGISVR